VIRPGIRRLFHLPRRRDDGDVDEELRLHLELRASQLERDGLTADAARAEALRRFGPLDEARRALRRTANRREDTVRLREMLDALWHDLRFAARGLRREPLFTGFVVSMLALGIGANATMFGIVDRLFLRGPGHVRDPERVMRLYTTQSQPGLGEYTADGSGYVLYDHLRHHTRSFAGWGLFSGGTATIGTGADARQIRGAWASASLFPLLGVRPQVGRFFDTTEDSTFAPQAVAVLGWQFWRSEYGGDPGVVGRTMLIGDLPYTIVGVAPRGFTGPELSRVDVWRPMSLHSQQVTPDWTTTWHAQWMQVYARLKPGVTREAAGTEATASHRAWYDGDDKVMGRARLTLAPLHFGESGRESSTVAVSRWLIGVTLVVLLIACTNVANLLLARGVRRQREVAVRRALGAGRARLARLLLSESMILALMAGAAGLLVALATSALVRRFLLSDIEWTSSPVSPRVLAFSAVVALVTGVLVGLAPAFQSSHADLTAALKSGTREGGGRRARLRGALTVAQAALSVVLLTGAGLFVRSLTMARSVDLGIQPGRVLVVEAQWPATPRPAADSDRARARKRQLDHETDFYRRGVEAVGRLRGVERAALTVGLPFQSSFSVYLGVPGYDSVPRLAGGGPYLSAVTPGYFATAGTPVLRGRAFTAADRAGSEPVTIVSRLMASTLWPTKDPIGQCLIIGRAKAPCARIVGVVGDAHRYSLHEKPAMHYYVPFGQEIGIGGTALLVRPAAGRDPELVAADVRKALRAVEPDVGYLSARMLDDIVSPLTRPWRLGASVFALCGVLALIVAAMGLYSVVSYLVVQRTHEIGVRMALGARTGDIVGLVMRSSVGMASVGVLLGVAISLAAGRFVEPLLFDTSPRDPVVLTAVALLLLATSVVASLLPAASARRVDPLVALRSE
jgi:predicted permease